MAANAVSNLSTINVSGGFYFPTFSLALPGRFFCAKLTIRYSTIFMYWDFMYLCGLGGTYLKIVYYFPTSIPVFSIIDTPPDSPFVIPKPLS